MRQTTLLLAVMGATLLLYVAGARAQPQTPPENFPARYVVVFEDNVQDPAAVAHEHARTYGLQLTYVYRYALKGYAAVFPNEQALRRVQADDRVAYVEPDGVVRPAA